MKILIINTFYYPEIRGGGEISVRILAEGLVTRGHEVFVLCDNRDGSVDETINGVKIFRRKFYYIEDNPSLFVKLIKAPLAVYNPLNKQILNDILNRINPDVCYTNNISRISRAAWLFLHKLNQITIDTRRDNRELTLANSTIKFLNPIFKSAMRLLSKYVDYSIFISEFMMSDYVDSRFFYHADKRVIYNTIDFNTKYVMKLVNDRKRDIESKRTFRFVYLGNLGKHKGIDISLDSFEKISAEYPDSVELHIAGFGELESMVKTAAEFNKNIVFHGWLDETGVCALLRSCDALLVPSVWDEPFGRIVLDAYRQGMPVIASRAGGLSETVIHEYTGLLVERGDALELNHAMRRLMEDKALYMRCCDNVIIELQKYSLNTYLDKYEELFMEVLRKRAA